MVTFENGKMILTEEEEIAEANTKIEAAEQAIKMLKELQANPDTIDRAEKLAKNTKEKYERKIRKNST